VLVIVLWLPLHLGYPHHNNHHGEALAGKTAEQLKLESENVHFIILLTSMFKNYSCGHGQLSQYADYMTTASNLHYCTSFKNHMYRKKNCSLPIEHGQFTFFMYVRKNIV
jgi:hypothetical protein